MIDFCGAADSNPQPGNTRTTIRKCKATPDLYVGMVQPFVIEHISRIQSVDLLRIKVIISKLKIVVITELPEDGPGGFMPAPLDK